MIFRICMLWLISLCSIFAQLVPNDTEFRVRLLSPINTETSRSGDQINAQVLAPQNYQGDILQGHIKQSKSGHKIKGEAALSFSFETLTHNGATGNVSTQVKSLANSQGKQNVDEEGRIVQKTNNLGKAALITGAGALIGALAGGAKGAAIGAGAGAAAALVLIQVSVKGDKMYFAPGSEFILSVKDR